MADARTRAFPALIAKVTNGDGHITGVHRTWLDPADPRRKAPVPSPRRAMGDLFGFGVRFGGEPPSPAPVLVAGEGLETILSLRMVMPTLPAVAALSANHLAAFRLPATLGRLYVAVDCDGAGRGGLARLSERARQAGIEVLALNPCLGDFNEDLRRLGQHEVAKHLGGQLVPSDVARLLPG
ncbi:toprim domain-containing protein [Lichenihabitans psoromatis]|uniref:toprim domain-containing protein n=1 Tax=Lichenihabitans psoromatis TaxID=2528642 RepID=UPI00315CF05C